jgi:hypothetical protein
MQKVDEEDEEDEDEAGGNESQSSHVDLRLPPLSTSLPWCPCLLPPLLPPHRLSCGLARPARIATTPSCHTAKYAVSPDSPSEFICIRNQLAA